MKTSGHVGSSSVRVAPDSSTGEGLSAAESACGKGDCEIVNLK